MDWSDGYVSDITYTVGFYRELAPSWLAFVAALQGKRAPDPDRPFAYCELGCGQGLGTNILAAAYPHGRFTGIDFNPAQIANARALAEEAALDNVAFRDESFREAADLPRDALPRFDFIALHGIYAWISESNRRAIVRFIRDRLTPGGLVYVSYNCMPGWAAMAPFQRLLVEHAARNPDRSDRQVAAGFAFADTLRAAGLAYFDHNPLVPKRIDASRDKDTQYLAHEYLNATWTPLFMPDVAAQMAEAKLEFLGSAAPLSNFDAMTLAPKAREALADITDPVFRELLKDYAVNRQFRHDIFVKGACQLTARQREAALIDRRFHLLRRPEAMTFTFQTPLGEATGQEEIYQPVVKALGDGVVRPREMARRTGLAMPKLVQAFAALTASSQIHPACGPVPPEPARRLNAAVARRSLDGEAYRFIAAPGIGNGLAATDVELMALEAVIAGTRPDADALIETIWPRYRRVGGSLKRDGKVLTDEAEARAEMRERLSTVVHDKAALWEAMALTPPTAGG